MVPSDSDIPPSGGGVSVMDDGVPKIRGSDPPPGGTQNVDWWDIVKGVQEESVGGDLVGKAPEEFSG